MTLRTDSQATLPDGRVLGYAECGDPDGIPVLVLHGWPGSRLGLAGPAQDAIASSRGIRLLAVERPGFGLSSQHKNRTIVDWPVDLSNFANAVSVGRFLLLGIGSATPYVAAAALRITHRLLGAGLIGGAAPANVDGGKTGLMGAEGAEKWAWFPWVLRRFTRRVGQFLGAMPGSLLDRMEPNLGPADRELLHDPVWRQSFIGACREAFRHGEDGPHDDLRLYLRPWGFDLSEIPMVMNLWAGGVDGVAGNDACDYLSRAFARSETRLYPSEGHFTLYAKRLGDILDGLLATARRESKDDYLTRWATSG